MPVICSGLAKGRERIVGVEGWIKRTLEDSDGGREVVDPSGGLESGNDDGWGGNEIVGKGVVQVALWCRVSDVLFARLGRLGGMPSLGEEWYLKLEDILDTVEFLLISVYHQSSQHWLSQGRL